MNTFFPVKFSRNPKDLLFYTYRTTKNKDNIEITLSLLNGLQVTENETPVSASNYKKRSILVVFLALIRTSITLLTLPVFVATAWLFLAVTPFIIVLLYLYGESKDNSTIKLYKRDVNVRENVGKFLIIGCFLVAISGLTITNMHMFEKGTISLIENLPMILISGVTIVLSRGVLGIITGYSKPKKEEKYAHHKHNYLSGQDVNKKITGINNALPEGIASIPTVTESAQGNVLKDEVIEKRIHSQFQDKTRKAQKTTSFSDQEKTLFREFDGMLRKILSTEYDGPYYTDESDEDEVVEN